MARVTHVKKAQQRYATVPVLDEDGQPKRTPVMKKVKNYDTGEVTEVQKTTKKGKPVFMAVTVADKDQPLEPFTCDHCRQPIEIGTPYKHITPKSGPYGGRKRTRHESCPTWQVWEYSSSLSARLAQISHDFWEAVDSCESPDDVTSALSDAQSAIQELAEEKRESASNIESGFGHATEKSEELEDIANQLESWADDVAGQDIPELPEPEEIECEDCGGTGQADQEEAENEDGEIEHEDCETCGGTGQMTPEEPTEDQMTEWLDQVRDELTLIDESPV